MDFQLTLLQNEIEHLNKNMGLMSEELVVLKEFIKKEFASKFEAFCNARKERRMMHQQMIVAEGESSSSSKKQYKTRKRIEIKCEPESAEMEQEVEGSEEETLFPVNEQSAEDDDSDFNFEVYPHDESGESSYKKGKPKSFIHKFFKHITTKEGKVRTKCYTCHEYVSNQAQRLKKHYEKCNNPDKEKKDAKKIPVARRPPPENTDGSSKVGRKLDRVRELFEEQMDNTTGNRGKMKCLSCGNLVSNQANRLRNHVEKCQGHQEEPSTLKLSTSYVPAGISGLSRSSESTSSRINTINESFVPNNLIYNQPEVPPHHHTLPPPLSQEIPPNYIHRHILSSPSTEYRGGQIATPYSDERSFLNRDDLNRSNSHIILPDRANAETNVSI